jgi:hypothetical protein
MLPFGVIIPSTVPQRSEIAEGLTNYPVYVLPISLNDTVVSKEEIFCGVSESRIVNKKLHFIINN